MAEKAKTKRKSGIPTGNAGEYLVMGELLRRGFDAQLADRNTKGYDMLVARNETAKHKRVQVKSVRSPPWYVRRSGFEGAFSGQVTIYVLVGPENSTKPVRYFIAKNSDVIDHIHHPQGWKENGFMALKSVEKFEGKWDKLAR